jgi:hypothetical protein
MLCNNKILYAQISEVGLTPEAFALLDVNPLTPELNPSAQHRLPRFFTGILIFKGLTARRLYK